MRDRNYAFNTISMLGDTYHAICRAFRNKWSWSPLDIDDMDILRVLKIFDELKEDEEKNGNQN
ncbi:MAG: hypothetical protein KAS32_02655 [Candidatus Peribacteraceae bacterium]|nr:hypothetical protein [Candidatus Peribacteraceae bacterium]